MRKLLENTFMLYIMKFAGYFFSLLTIPYQTRVLDKEHYGVLVLAISVMFYFQLIIDFGFMITGVAEVAKNINNKDRVSYIMTKVLAIQLILMTVSLGGLSVLLGVIDNYSKWKMVFYLFFAAVCVEAWMPAFLFRGMEDMRKITMLSLVSKALATSLVFVFVKDNATYWMVPVCRLLGGMASLAIAWCLVVYKYHLRLVKVSVKDMWKSARESFGYFISRISGCIYGGGNVAIMGTMYSAAYIAVYSNAEKLMHVGMSVSSPIADSLLPHIARSKDYSAAFKLIKWSAPFIVGAGVIGFIFAEPIVTLIFGQEYAGSADVLRILIPVMAITLPNYIIAFPVLVPMGLGQHSNLANIIGSVVYISCVVGLLSVGKFNMYTASATLLITEFIVMSYRCSLLFFYRKRLHG